VFRTISVVDCDLLARTPLSYQRGIHGEHGLGPATQNLGVSAVLSHGQGGSSLLLGIKGIVRQVALIDEFGRWAVCTARRTWSCLVDAGQAGQL